MELVFAISPIRITFVAWYRSAKLLKKFIQKDPFKYYIQNTVLY